MIISLSGTPGSGKSTVSKILSKKLSFPHYSSGDFRRAVAKKRGITLEELNNLAEKDFSIDDELDQYQKKLGETNDNFLIDGRTSWHFIPHSIKFFLDAKPLVRAKRIFEEKRSIENFKTLDFAKKKILERQNADKKRYKKYYGIDVYDKSNYDFAIDASSKSPEEIVDLMLEKIKLVKEEIYAGAIVVNSKREYLLLFKSKGKFWEFPKGHLEQNETELGAAKREVREETGIRSFVMQPNFAEVIHYVYKEKNKKQPIISKIVFYHLAKSDDQVRISKEHSKFKWASFEEAQKLIKFDDLKNVLIKTNNFLIDLEEKNKFQWL